MTRHDRFPYDPPGLSPRPGGLPVRTTAAAFIIDGGRMLLEKRPEGRKTAAGFWDTPGGHVEPGEAPEEALVREMREELGIEARRFKLGMVQDEHDQPTGLFYRHFVYILTEWTGEARACEGQHVAWHAVEEVAKLPGLNPLVGHALEHFTWSGWLPA